MITIIILAILTMALITTVSMNMLSISTQTEQVLSSAEERAQVISIKNNIKSALLPLGEGQTYLAPVGDISDAGYMTLPNNITVNNLNSWGYRYMYCPYSQKELTNSGSEQIPTASSSYSVNVVNNSEGKKYVYESANPSVTGMNILATLISPIPSTTLPSCEDLRYSSESNEFYLVNYNGLVDVIRADSISRNDHAVVSDINSSETATGVNKRLESWSSTLPEVMTINFEAGTYETQSHNINNPVSIKNKQISFIGEGNNISTVSATQPEIITFKNVVVSIKDISFSDDVKLTFENSDVYLEDADISSVSFKNSSVYGSGGVVINSFEDVLVKNSFVDFSNSNTTIVKRDSQVGVELLNSEMLLSNTTFQNYSSGGVGVVLDTSSELTLKGTFYASGQELLSLFSLNSNADMIITDSSISVSSVTDTILYSMGNIIIKNSDISMSAHSNNGILLDVDAELSLSNSVLGNGSVRPTYGVRDFGGTKSVSGNSSTIYSTNECWLGDIFSGTSGQDGEYSQTYSTSYQAVNKSNWLCVIN